CPGAVRRARRRVSMRARHRDAHGGLVGVAAAARRGIVVRTAAVLERLAAVRCALLDKTGTLTARQLRLVAVEPAPGSGLDADQLLVRAAALEAGLTHPLAQAVVEAAHARR